MGPEDLVLVCWLQSSAWPTSKESPRRKPGFEDVMKYEAAKQLQRAGMVKIVGKLDKVECVSLVVGSDGEGISDASEEACDSVPSDENEDEAGGLYADAGDGSNDLWDFCDS